MWIWHLWPATQERQLCFHCKQCKHQQRGRRGRPAHHSATSSRGGRQDRYQTCNRCTAPCGCIWSCSNNSYASTPYPLCTFWRKRSRCCWRRWWCCCRNRTPRVAQQNKCRGSGKKKFRWRGCCSGRRRPSCRHSKHDIVRAWEWEWGRPRAWHHGHISCVPRMEWETD